MSQFDELPEGWYLEEIQNLCDFGPKHPKELSDDLEISFVPMPAVDDVTGTIQKHETRRLGEVKKGYTHFADGDVIFAKITPCMENGKAAVAADLINGIACGSTEFHVLRSNGSVLPNYIYRYLRQQSYRDNASQAMTGAVGQRRVPKQFLLETKLPLPSRNEQRRIVEKIEALTARSRKARAALDQIPALLDQFRQSVLAAAFRGDLTADWRAQNPNVEPASELLDKTQLHSAKQKRIKVQSGIDDPFNLPKSWIWVRLFDICKSITDGDHLPPPKANSGIPFLTISNITSGKLDFNQIRYVPEDYYNKIDESRVPRKGDILYTVVGATYGTPVLVDTDTKFCFQRHIAILKLSFLVDRNYLLYGLKSDLVYRQATNATTGTAQPTVTLSGLRPIKIPFPPILEQEEIARKITRFFETADQIEQFYESNRF